ncbi:unnamed protein product [Polarella glacialis]|uniref:Peroxisome biogenesis protein 22 n=1 Tax=Polarella glacialis TaxID=89957 RepID=A0A813DYQ3_POLGL|nr:unnamed protein product [Polarella glacialis]
MAPNLLAELLNKRNAPYFIWTAIALLCALYFWFSNRASPQSASSSGSGSSQNGSDSHSSGSGNRRDGTANHKRNGARNGRRPTVSVSLDTLLALPVDVADSMIASFLELCSGCEVFAFALADSDEGEADAARALEAMGAFSSGLLLHRLMFASTLAGRASMVRQLQPDVHLESAPLVAEELKGKVRNVRLLGSSDFPTFREAASSLF